MKATCSCEDADCLGELRFEFTSGQCLITMIGKGGKESLMYQDANEIVKMIIGLKEGLLKMTNLEDVT